MPIQKLRPILPAVLAALGLPLVAVAEDDAPATAKRTPAEIRKTLGAIEPPGKRIGRSQDAIREAALRRLKAYRYLAGVPYKHLTLDDELNDYAKAAAMLCRKLGRLEHNPKTNPGLSMELFEKARKGARNCSLATMSRRHTLAGTIDRYMEDSDARNIRHLGHRRWCLNPTMGKTGFGWVTGYAAMWTMDTSHKAPEYDYVPYPPAGLMPVAYFSVDHAWNVSLNPRKYKAPGAKVKVAVYSADARAKTPLELRDLYTSSFPSGIRYCVIFRPTAKSLAGKRKLAVVITGLETRAGKPATIEYTVEFVKLRK